MLSPLKALSILTSARAFHSDIPPPPTSGARAFSPLVCLCAACRFRCISVVGGLMLIIRTKKIIAARWPKNQMTTGFRYGPAVRAPSKKTGGAGRKLGRWQPYQTPITSTSSQLLVDSTSVRRRMRTPKTDPFQMRSISTTQSSHSRLR